MARQQSSNPQALSFLGSTQGSADAMDINAPGGVLSPISRQSGHIATKPNRSMHKASGLGLAMVVYALMLKAKAKCREQPAYLEYEWYGVEIGTHTWQALTSWLPATCTLAQLTIVYKKPKDRISKGMRMRLVAEPNNSTSVIVNTTVSS